MNYSCDKFLDPHDLREWNYSIREIQTGQIIASFRHGIAGYAIEARRYTAFLNNGGAFDGYTPTFVLQKVDIPINSEFEAAFGD